MARTIGAVTRDLRVKAGLTEKQVADGMSVDGATWDAGLVRMVEADEMVHLTVAEFFQLMSVLGGDPVAVVNALVQPDHGDAIGASSSGQGATPGHHLTP